MHHRLIETRQAWNNRAPISDGMRSATAPRFTWPTRWAKPASGMRCARSPACAGSFTPVGGHNPYEPAYAGSAMLHGPLYANFAQTYADFDAEWRRPRGGRRPGPCRGRLVSLLTIRRSACKAMQDKSRAFAAAQEDMLDDITEHALTNGARPATHGRGRPDGRCPS